MIYLMDVIRALPRVSVNENGIRLLGGELRVNAVRRDPGVCRTTLLECPLGEACADVSHADYTSRRQYCSVTPLTLSPCLQTRHYLRTHLYDNSFPVYIVVVASPLDRDYLISGTFVSPDHSCAQAD